MGSGVIGSMVRGPHVSRALADQRRRVPSRPESSWTIIHFERSVTFAFVPPAGAVASTESNGTISTGPSVSRPCGVPRSRRRVQLEPGVRRGHPEGVEDLVLDEGFPTLACDRGEDLAGGDVHHVVVGVCGAKSRDEFGGMDPPHDLVTRVIGMEPVRSPAPSPSPLGV